jgi:hypothetical protein
MVKEVHCREHRKGETMVDCRQGKFLKKVTEDYEEF